MHSTEVPISEIETSSLEKPEDRDACCVLLDKYSLTAAGNQII
jgi:hypothetical protein